ncbi:hypothetical protein FRB95_004302 [Tulasnella sp. JGI-2019a]|nr:hypothetical protein FRB93_003018 [Tulasnella sp. JGI-2019a]KAG9030113.1 hypothetical protein FRB95_004302 [Tulasnella sp. JGI-2019a]
MASTSTLNTPTQGVNTRSSSPNGRHSRGASPLIIPPTDPITPANPSTEKEPSPIEAAYDILTSLSGLTLAKLGTKGSQEKVKEVTALVKKALTYFRRNHEEVLTKADLQKAMEGLRASLTSTTLTQNGTQSYTARVREGTTTPTPQTRPALSDDAQAKQVLISLKHTTKSSPFLKQLVAELADMFNKIIAKWVAAKHRRKLNYVKPV